jgi:hypothetical protein
VLLLFDPEVLGLLQQLGTQLVDLLLVVVSLLLHLLFQLGYLFPQFLDLFLEALFLLEEFFFKLQAFLIQSLDILLVLVIFLLQFLVLSVYELRNLFLMLHFQPGILRLLVRQLLSQCLQVSLEHGQLAAQVLLVGA